MIIACYTFFMVSVVIPAYNEEKHIGKCLESFLHQTTEESFEVILVDNASTDKTVEVAKTFIERIPLQILEEKRQGRGYARATGFEKAKGDIILSTDSDGYVPKDWIEKILKMFDDPEVIAMTGPVRVYDLPLWKTKLVQVGVPFTMLLYRLLYKHYWLTGSNFAIRKDIYEKSGGFADVHGLEDIDLSIRVSQLGKIKYKPFFVWTSGRRFRNAGSGLKDYLKAYVAYFWQKNGDTYFPNSR